MAEEGGEGRITVRGAHKQALRCIYHVMPSDVNGLEITKTRDPLGNVSWSREEYEPR